MKNTTTACHKNLIGPCFSYMTNGLWENLVLVRVLVLQSKGCVLWILIFFSLVSPCVSDLGHVSRKSQKLFGPEKPFVKLLLAYSVKLVFCCKGNKNENNFKVSCLETPFFWRYKESCVTRNRPEKFREFWETDPCSAQFPTFCGLSDIRQEPTVISHSKWQIILIFIPSSQTFKRLEELFFFYNLMQSSYLFP